MSKLLCLFDLGFGHFGCIHHSHVSAHCAFWFKPNLFNFMIFSHCVLSCARHSSHVPHSAVGPVSTAAGKKSEIFHNCLFDLGFGHFGCIHHSHVSAHCAFWFKPNLFNFMIFSHCVLSCARHSSHVPHSAVGPVSTAAGKKSEIFHDWEARTWTTSSFTP